MGIPKTRLLTPPLLPQLRKRRQRRQRKPQRLPQLNLRPKRRRLLRKERGGGSKRIKYPKSCHQHQYINQQIKSKRWCFYSTQQYNPTGKKKIFLFHFKHEENLPYLIR